MCPPFAVLPGVADALTGVKIDFAQNMHWAENSTYPAKVAASDAEGRRRLRHSSATQATQISSRARAWTKIVAAFSAIADPHHICR